MTVLLDATTLFTLTVMDAQTGCICAAPDDITVFVTGNALAVNPAATPDTICSGDTVQLYSLATGGSGLYEYYWTSTPPGFTSTLANPLVTPTQNTLYNVSLTDGYTYVNGTINITVFETPVFDLGPDGTVCVFDTLTLDAGAHGEGTSYLWSNGATSQTIMVGTTGIGFDVKNLSVTVTSADGCVVTDQRTIVFDYAVCTGIDDQDPETSFYIYPNPGNGILRIENRSGKENCTVSVADIYGREIIKDQEISFNSDNILTLNLDKYPHGIYLVRISQNGRTLAAVKYLLR